MGDSLTQTAAAYGDMSQAKFSKHSICIHFDGSFFLPERVTATLLLQMQLLRLLFYFFYINCSRASYAEGFKIDTVAVIDVMAIVGPFITGFAAM